uniref:G_PROTEIN_RECEP_F1_2 domain-containing protein n=1 Tax=Rhodnius prolixus TaxID=13249 RepID=T1HD92_RHOPR
MTGSLSDDKMAVSSAKVKVAVFGCSGRYLLNGETSRRFLFLIESRQLPTFSSISTVLVSFELANALILASLRWIRRPLSPTLHISLSLAGADMFTSLVIGIGLIVNSLLPQVFSIQIDKCSQLVIEALRMGGMYTSIGHLLTLAVNHYLGIKKPLHYPSLMTTRNITVIVLALWIIPPSSFAIYFSLLEQDGFAIIGCDYE